MKYAVERKEITVTLTMTRQEACILEAAVDGYTEMSETKQRELMAAAGHHYNCNVADQLHSTLVDIRGEVM